MSEPVLNTEETGHSNPFGNWRFNNGDDNDVNVQTEETLTHDYNSGSRGSITQNQNANNSLDPQQGSLSQQQQQQQQSARYRNKNNIPSLQTLEEDKITDSTSPVTLQPPVSGIPTGFNQNRRTSVSSEVLTPTVDSANDDRLLYPKTPQQYSRIEESIDKNFLFQDLDAESKKSVLDAFKEIKFKTGDVIIKQFDKEGEYSYVIDEGEVDYYVSSERPLNTSNVSSPGSFTKPKKTFNIDELRELNLIKPEYLVSSAGPGALFGELALMYNSERAASVIAKTDVTLWALDRHTFRSNILKRTTEKRQIYEDFLKEVPILKVLSEAERSKLAHALTAKRFYKDDVIINEGETECENFYIIIKGKANVVKTDVGIVQSLKKGDYFGELALLDDDDDIETIESKLTPDGKKRRLASVIAATDIDVATLDKGGFDRLLGPAKEILKQRDPTAKHNRNRIN